MLKQQLIGIINLSLPIIILFLIYPVIFSLWMGNIACAVAIGLYVWYLNRKSLHAMTSSLTFKPTLEWKQSLEAQILACGLNPEKIRLFYAYTNESLAISSYDAIIIDPVIRTNTHEDPEALKVIDIFNTAISPALSELQKIRTKKIQELFSKNAESFIFKHELGHIAHHSSYKKLMLVFLIATLATYSGIITALCVAPINGWLAIAAGMLVGGISDLALSWLSNGICKVYDENQADAFAIRYSSAEEIEAAATFFEQYQDILDQHGDKHALHGFVPQRFATGYLNGKIRAQLLRSSSSI